jgi:hypothetical protein
MEYRFSRIAALGALAVMSWAAQMVMAGELGRLAALAARQDLYDEVCIARAGGEISPPARRTILCHAKQILTPQEYEAFKTALNRIAPPPPPSVAKHPAIKRLPKVAEQKLPATRGWFAKTTPRLAVPGDTIQPDRLTDRVALAGGMR